MKIVKCIKKFSVQMCNDDGFEIENKEFIVKENTVWEVDESIGTMIGGEIRLLAIDNDSCGWIEICEETFFEFFEEVE